MKKKFLAALLCAVMALSVVACGSKESKKDTEKTIEITIPASIMFKDEEGDLKLDDKDKEQGIKNITKNSDGSITLEMTEEGHKKLLNDLKKTVDKNIEDLLADKENCPSFNKITYNDDLSEFTIEVNPDLYTEDESSYAIDFYFSGNIYQSLNSVPEDKLNVDVIIVDQTTKEVITTGNSASMIDTLGGDVTKDSFKSISE